MFFRHTFATNMTAEIKNNILQKVAALFFRYGIKSVTMDDIARELGMSKKTLYQFFENKNDMLTQIFQMEEMRDIEMTKCIIAEAENAVDELLGFAKHGVEEFAKIMSSSTIVYDLHKYYRDLWSSFEANMNRRIYDGTKANLERGKREGLYRPDLDADMLAKLYVRQLMSFIDEETFPTKQYNKVQLFKQYLVYHVHGIATQKGITLFNDKMKALFGSEPRL
ncbi:MAG: TetR/AcrR family transcriptional regulator [Saprospiraceae bacterium]|nr:TetR/AcrR family transcriptional regulator [Saprospiraceae bacterium]